MGGFDGNEMVSSVEVFDPRIGSWMNGEPMNQSRGYSAVAVLKDSIYVIGGVEVGADIIDTVCWHFSWTFKRKRGKEKRDVSWSFNHTWSLDANISSFTGNR